MILVADDDGDCCTLVVELLERAGFRTARAGTGVEALNLARRVRPALVVLDVSLPEMNGYEVCSELRGDFGPDLPIVFLSGDRTEPLDRVAGLLIGADDYIVKPFDADELVARVRRLASRHEARANGTQTVPDNATGSAIATLTPRELQILGLLVDGLSQPEIAVELVISEKTVATHIQRILGKLGVHSRAQAVALAAHVS